MITLKEVLSNKEELIKSLKDPQKVIQAHLEWIRDNVIDFDAEATRYFDEFTYRIADLKLKQLSKMPDSPTNRDLIRKAHNAQGKFPNIKQYLGAFSAPPKEIELIDNDWEKYIIESVEIANSYIFDIRQGKCNKHELIFLSTFVSCIDELIAYIHLAKYRYYTQANAHLRTVYESLELIDLFKKDPSTIDLWFSKNWKDREKLSPKNIRIALGRNKFDPLYKFLCEHGTHQTSESFSHRTLGGATDENKHIAYTSIGGTKRVDVQIQSYNFGIMIAHMLVSKIAICFEDRLNAEEGINNYDNLTASYTNFFKDHFKKWAESEGMEVKDIEEAFSKISDPEESDED